MTFLEYQSTNGRRYALHPRQIGGFEGNDRETIVHAAIAGRAIDIRIGRPYKDVYAEWKRAIGQEEEQAA